MELTTAQWALLLGLVARATLSEEERVARMQARPAGTHSLGAMKAAQSLAADFAALEAEVKKEAGSDAGLCSSGEPQEPCGPNCTGQAGCPGCEAREAYYEAMEAEQAKLSAMPSVRGCRPVALEAECESCGQVRAVLYERVACTLGYSGHPGAEWTAFQVCGGCLL